ncbi:MAG: Fe-S cluster assembly protein SufD, partial [Bdellovibrionales bacterium]|nr:Fe-S cluster assembly protein SufD [Bdellovibrionales bacterium]
PSKEKCFNFLSNLSESENTIFLFDGHYLPGLSDRFLKSKNLKVIDQSESDFAHKLNVFEEYMIGPEDVLRSINSAYSTNFLIMQFNGENDEPLLKVKNIEINESQDYLFSTPRILIDVQAGATQIEFLFSSKNTYFSNVVLDVFIGTNCQLNLSLLLEPNENKSLFVSNRVHMEENGKLNTTSLLFGSELTRLEQEVFAEGENTFSNLACAYVCGGHQQVDVRSIINHDSPKGKSHQLIKGILDEKSRATVNGRIFIHEGAQKVDANLLNNNLLLCESAEVNTKPELEVEADDVKAAHGATVGQLNKEELFYLESRAINKDLAKRLLLKGFMVDSLNPGNLHQDSQLLNAFEVYFDRKY